MSNPTRFTLVLLLSLAPALAASGGERPKRSKEEVAAARQASREKWRGVSELRKLTAVKIEKKQGDTEVLRGFVTYALPNPEAMDKTVAYVFLRWGDLDNKVKGKDKGEYQDWSGYVRVSPGRVTLAEGFGFDDGGANRHKWIADATDRQSEARRKAIAKVDETYRKRFNSISRNRKKADNRAKAVNDLNSWRQRQLRAVDQRYSKQQGRLKAGLKAREGSDRDETLEKRTRCQVVWKSGAVGTADGVLFRLDLDGATATGAIKAGRFVIPFAVVPKPDDVKPEPKRPKRTPDGKRRRKRRKRRAG